MTKTLVALSVTLLLGACSMAPDYQRPELPQGASWQSNQTAGEAAVSPGSNSFSTRRCKGSSTPHWRITGICGSRLSTSRRMKPGTVFSGRRNCRPWQRTVRAPASRDPTISAARGRGLSAASTMPISASPPMSWTCLAGSRASKIRLWRPTLPRLRPGAAPRLH